MKIAELQEILAKATPRPWSTHDAGGTTVSAPDGETDVADCAMEATVAHSEGWAAALADAAAIAALGNHADALLELWRAVDAYINGEDDLKAKERAMAAALAALDDIQ